MKRAIVVITFLVVATAVMGQAEARRGVVFYQSGEDVFETGPLPEPYNTHPKLKGVNAGYICKVFGLFWAYMHIWNCRPVGIQGDSVYTDEKLVAAISEKYKESDMQVGLWAKHGRWVFALVIVLAIAGFIFGRGKGDDDDEDEEA